MPSVTQLTRRHPEHIQYAKHWALLSKLASGGTDVDIAVKKELLINPDQSDTAVLDERVKMAPYDSVIGGILMKIVSQLMQDKAACEGSKDDFFEEQFFPKGALLPNDDDARASFHSFLTSSILNALIQGKAIAQVDTRKIEAFNRAEQITYGGMDAYVILRDRCDLWDWQIGDNGLTFAKLHNYEETRETWESKLIRKHVFTVYQRALTGQIYGSVYSVQLRDDLTEQDESRYRRFDDRALLNLKDDDVLIVIETEPSEIFHVIEGGESIFKFPIVMLNIPKPLQIVDQLFDLQKALFNKVASKEWALLQTNYAQLVFTGIDRPHEEGNANVAKDQISGDGYHWELSTGQDAKWLVRDPGGIDLALRDIDTLRKNMFEMVGRIAETAATEYATRVQSGESKREQRRDLDMLLEVYGAQIRDYATHILNCASIIRQENIEWEVSGFCNYNSDGLTILVENYKGIVETGLDSSSLRRECLKAIAGVAIQEFGLEESLLEKIENELQNNPYTLNSDQRDNLVRLVTIGKLSDYGYLSILKAAGDLPEGFDIDAEVNRIQGVGGILPLMPPNTVLGAGTETPAISEPEAIDIEDEPGKQSPG